MSTAAIIDEAIPPSPRMSGEDGAAALEAAFASLDPRSSDIFRSRHPIDGSQPVPPKELASRHGVSPSRVSQIDTMTAAALASGPHSGLFRSLLKAGGASVAEAVRSTRGPKSRDPSADAALLALDPIAALAMKVVHNGDYVAWSARTEEAFQALDVPVVDVPSTEDAAGPVRTPSEDPDASGHEESAGVDVEPVPTFEEVPPEVDAGVPPMVGTGSSCEFAPSVSISRSTGHKAFVDALRRETVLGGADGSGEGPWKSGSSHGLVAASTLLDLLERRKSTLDALSLLPGLAAPRLASAVSDADGRIDRLRKAHLPGRMGAEAGTVPPVRGQPGPGRESLEFWFAREDLPVDLRRFVREEIGRLGGARTQIFEARHPMDGSEPSTIQDIAEKLGMSGGAVGTASDFAKLKLRDGTIGRVLRRILLDSHSVIASALEEAGPVRVSSMFAEKLVRSRDPFAAVAFRVVYEADFDDWRRDHVSFRTDRPEATGPGTEPPDDAAAPNRPATVAETRVASILALGAGVPLPSAVLKGRTGLGIPPAMLSDASKAGASDGAPDGYVLPVRRTEADLLSARLHACAVSAPFPFLPWDLSGLHERRFGTPVAVRDVQSVLASRPHLFVRLHDDAWFASTGPVPKHVSTPLPRTGLREVDAGDDEVLVHLARHLLAEGPESVDTLVSLARRTFGAGEVDVAVRIRTSALFERHGPASVRAAGASDDCANFGTVDDEACTLYALALRSGTNRGWYRLWTYEYEQRLCTWAAVHRPELLPDLLLVASPGHWPSEGAVRREWCLRKNAQEARTLVRVRKESPARFAPAPVRLVAGLAQAVAGGSLGWFQARRIFGNRNGLSCSGTGMLALLVGLGALEAPDDWLEPHRATARAPAILAALLDELGWSGKLTWNVGVPSDLLSEATVGDGRGWIGTREFEDLVAALAGAATAA